MDKRTEEDWLDRQLREAAPYIDDDGFTRRVLGKLPAPRRRRSSSRAVILIGLTLLGSLIAYVISDGGRFVTEELMRLAALPMWWIFLLALASGALVTAIGFAAALSKSRELQS
jgi:hypothetical protein